MKLVDKEKIERSLNVAIVGLTQARRNRTRYIRQLGDTYYQYAGKISLYNMMKLVEELYISNQLDKREGENDQENLNVSNNCR